MGVYIVWVRIKCIRIDSSAKQNVSQRKPYLWDTHEIQLSPSCPDSSHSSHVQGTCITSRDAYSWATCENTSVFNLPGFFTHTLSLTQPLQIKTHMKYRVQKLDHNYNQIWHGIKVNKNIVVNYNFTLFYYSEQVQLLPLLRVRERYRKSSFSLRSHYSLV